MKFRNLGRARKETMQCCIHKAVQEVVLEETLRKACAQNNKHARLLRTEIGVEG